VTTSATKKSLANCRCGSPRRVSHCLEDRDAARIPGSTDPSVFGGGNYSVWRVSDYIILGYLQCPSRRPQRS
jgi:hypothetical protein